MRRRLLLLAAVLAATPVAAVLAVPALAGGYCHTPATDERGTTVTMREYCYGPTVLRVPEGAQVTFVNRDSVNHPTVGRGSDWGFDGYAAGRSTVRFDESGVYPYFCHEHIGMIGVIVVGDGRAAAAAAPVRVADPPAAQPAAEPAASQQHISWSVPGAVLLGLGLAGAAVVMARRRRAGAAPQA